MNCDTVKIVPTSPEQGEFVVINAEDFDPSTMKKYGEVEEEKAPARRGRKPKEE